MYVLMKKLAFGNCIKGIKDKPIQVNFLEKYVNNWARENEIQYEYKMKETNNIEVAIIGSGPAGISCAVELAKKGYRVTIFEKESEIGGLLTYGIPGFRLPRDITKELTNRIKQMGIHIKTNIELGKDIKIENLNKQGYKAVFLGIGAEIPSSYTLSNEDSENIYKSNYILKKYNAKEIVENLGDVIVIGGGNVATDSARAAIRMGATTSTIVYRRDKDKMPARQVELDEAIADGVNIIYNTKVTGANIKNGKIQEVNCIKTDTSGEKVIDIQNSEFCLKADSIIFAIGLKPDKELLKKEGLELEDNGLIKIDNNYMTNIKGVFAGGDVSQSKATVCMAIKQGKEAAENIDKYLTKK